MFHEQFAQYYDKIYLAQGKDYEKEVCRLHRLVQQYKRSPGHRLLDVGCGTGEHLRYLRYFYHVEGVDISTEMLAIAREKLPGVPFHQGDMRTFDLGTKFDVVTCLFGTIGYVETLDGLQQAVENMGRHLTPGGVLVIEPWLGPGAVQDGRTHVVVVNEPDEKVVRIGVTRVQGNISEIQFHFAVATREGIQTFEERHRLGLFKPEAYVAAFRKCGLEVYFDEQGISGRGIYIGYGPA